MGWISNLLAGWIAPDPAPAYSSTDADGVRTFADADGVLVTHPDGTVVWQPASGDLLINYPDGSDFYACEWGVATTQADGREIEHAGEYAYPKRGDWE